mmetsp:Transcript_9612/g.32595  ORF Transcript_9612/g.32595 Transcript_9612/m.32595 type:complete len:263 (-) Transcript_9612:543-1331(-)
MNAPEATETSATDGPGRAAHRLAHAGGDDRVDDARHPLIGGERLHDAGYDKGDEYHEGLLHNKRLGQCKAPAAYHGLGLGRAEYAAIDDGDRAAPGVARPHEDPRDGHARALRDGAPREALGPCHATIFGQLLVGVPLEQLAQLEESVLVRIQLADEAAALARSERVPEGRHELPDLLGIDCPGAILVEARKRLAEPPGLRGCDQYFLGHARHRAAAAVTGHGQRQVVRVLARVLDDGAPGHGGPHARGAREWWRGRRRAAA